MLRIKFLSFGDVLGFEDVISGLVGVLGVGGLWSY